MVYSDTTGCNHYLEEPAFFLLQTLVSGGPQSSEALTAKIEVAFSIEDTDSLKAFVTETVRQLTRLELIA